MSRFGANGFLVFSIIVSSFGMMTISLLVLNPSGYGYNDPWRKPIIGLAFGSLCLLGLCASISPKSCHIISNRVGVKAQSEDGFRGCGKNLATKGHHADCGRFSGHTIRLWGKCVCAACSGLAFGAFCALIGVAAYLLLGRGALQPSAYWAVAGQVGVVLGLVQFRARGFIRFALNGVFVFSAFLILIGIDNLTKSLSADFYTVGVILAWIFIRIMLSQRDHQRICFNCSAPKVRENTK
jgi:hypothetical protein